MEHPILVLPGPREKQVWGSSAFEWLLLRDGLQSCEPHLCVGELVEMVKVNSVIYFKGFC